MGRKRQVAGCNVDMTPMIDVVFQLIIFFIVTLKMEDTKNEDIELSHGKHGPTIEDRHPTTLVVEVDRRGWISIQGAQLNRTQLRQIMRGRYQRFGQYPVLIRGDRRAKHNDIRAVMDVCTGVGIWKISFAAIQQEV